MAPSPDSPIVDGTGAELTEGQSLDAVRAAFDRLFVRHGAQSVKAEDTAPDASQSETASEAEVT